VAQHGLEVRVRRSLRSVRRGKDLLIRVSRVPEKYGIHGVALETEEHAKARAEVLRRVRALTGERLAA